MLNYVKRMVTEKEDLEGKIKRAVEAIHNQKNLKLDETQVNLLETQVNYMREYHKILGKRISYETNGK